MEVMVVIALLCLSLFALQTPCTSLQIQLLQSNKQANAVEQLSPPTMPRKLRFTEELVGFKTNGAHQHSISHSKQKEQDVSGKLAKKEEEEGRAKDRVRVHGNGSGKQQQRVVEEGPDHDHDQLSKYYHYYFTMDYSHVRRRRPIHNKSLPAAP